MKRAEFQQIGGALLGTLCQHCKTGTPADVREVLAAGRQRLRLDLFTKAGPEGLLPLTVACLAKNVPVIEALLEAGAKVGSGVRVAAAEPVPLVSCFKFALAE
jgi:hypothetical protein